MFFISLLLIVAAEVVAFVLVGDHVGFLWALLILILVSACGPFVVRRVGSGVLARTRERLALGEVPTRELLDGLVVLVGGVMICVPGFIGDALGLLLMIGPIANSLAKIDPALLEAARDAGASRWRTRTSPSTCGRPSGWSCPPGACPSYGRSTSAWGA